MSDLIDRQAAIDTLDKHLRTTDVPVSYPGIISALTEWLNELPSAQADSKETSSTHKALDTISRQAALNALSRGSGCGASCHRAIKALPSAQPEQRWVPVTERPPEDLEEVNVTWINHIPEPYYDFLKDKSFTGSAVYYRGDWYWYSSRCTDILAEYGTNGMDKVDDGIEITAWMPLPEPARLDGEADG